MLTPLHPAEGSEERPIYKNRSVAHKPGRRATLPLPSPGAQVRRTQRRAQMPPRGVRGTKNKRMYEKIKRSAKGHGRSTKTAKRIAAATVNKFRRKQKSRRSRK